jgi:hypothetical protein
LARYFTDEPKIKVLIIHDDLNAGGGSERLADTTIETLNEIGFIVNLATFRMPDMVNIQSTFNRPYELHSIDLKSFGKKCY